jgi:hypothetical protein
VAISARVALLMSNVRSVSGLSSANRVQVALETGTGAQSRLRAGIGSVAPMKRIGSVLAGLVALAIILIALGGLVYGVIEDPAVVGPLTAAAVVIGLAIYQRRWEKSQELDRLHREQMSPTYTKLAEMVKSIDEFVGKPLEEQEAFFKQVSTTLLLHAPSSVVRTWVAWMRSLGEPLPTPLRTQESLLRAIREDLGLKSAGLLPGDLIRLYVRERRHGRGPRPLETGHLRVGSPSMLANRICAAIALSAVGVAVLSACGNTEQASTATTPAQPAITHARAEHIWLRKFESLFVGAENGEPAQTLHTNGIEQECKAEGNGYHCKGVIPEENNNPFPSKEENCMVVEATVTSSGQVKDDSAEPLKKYREALHAEVECHL